MANIITKYSDYIINSIEYFIERIETELRYRDLPGLSNNTIEIIKVTKEHPLVALLSTAINDTRNSDLFRSGFLPAISVTPTSSSDEGFTLGQSYQPETVNAEFISQLNYFLDKSSKEIKQEVLMTKSQIELIISEYKKNAEETIRVQRNQWNKNEEISISVWSENADHDILLGNLMDSIMATIQIGFVGDNSALRKFQYRITKGLTNFNFGRTLFGTEYSLTFLNTFNNYIIYSDDIISGHDFIGTFETPGEE